MVIGLPFYGYQFSSHAGGTGTAKTYNEIATNNPSLKTDVDTVPLTLFNSSAETEAMATAVDNNGGVYLVPAFSGLGSPHWQMDRKASVTGMSFGTTKNHIVRAALESIPYQVKDVISAMEKDAGLLLKELNTDGGMTSHQFVLQFIADLLYKPVASIGMPDVSALGAAYLAGLKVGVYENINELKKLNADKKYYSPSLNKITQAGYQGWLNVIYGKNNM